jgi:hypothetical protein
MHKLKRARPQSPQPLKLEAQDRVNKYSHRLLTLLQRQLRYYIRLLWSSYPHLDFCHWKHSCCLCCSTAQRPYCYMFVISAVRHNGTRYMFKRQVMPPSTLRASITHAKPFSWFAASNAWPILTKSRSRNCGFRLAPLRGTQPLTLLRMLKNFRSMLLSVTKRRINNTYEVTLFVVGASMGSLTMTPSPMGMMFSLREWLIKYEWSAVDNGPAVRLTLHEKLGSVTLNGVSQIYRTWVNFHNVLFLCHGPPSQIQAR